MLIGYYYFIINILTFVFFSMDKRRAVKKKWRIPESKLFLCIFLGGFLGAACSMKINHHKTRKLSFRLSLLSSGLFHIIFWIYLKKIVSV